MSAAAPRLARAVAAQPETPCLQFGCPRVARCAASGAACTAFMLYAETGRVIEPTPETAAVQRAIEGGAA